MITDLKVSIFLLNGDREQKQLLLPILLTTVNWKERPFASVKQHMTHFKLVEIRPASAQLPDSYPLQLHSPAHVTLSRPTIYMFAFPNFMFL